MSKDNTDRPVAGINVEELVEEISRAELGDKRRKKRLMEVVRQLAARPAESFSAASGTEAALEGMYRFFRNPHVQWEEIISPHIEATAQRGRQAGNVLAIHDTSTIRLPDAAEFESYIQTGKRGFFAHSSILVDMDRHPLGLASMEIIKRPKKQARTRKGGRALSGGETHRLKNREFLRWWRGVEQVEERLDGTNVVHVMDREADSYELLHALHSAQKSFVIRWCKERNARSSDNKDAPWSKVSEILANASPLALSREVNVGRRKAKTAPRARKASPSRRKRKAHLRISCSPIEFKKPQYLPVSEGFSRTLSLNVVRVYEPNPPHDQDAIEWMLLTNLPIDETASVAEIVDIYRTRWLIEEFFKALKTGCGYRTRRLTNPHSILNSFATLIPIAAKALALRRAAEPDAQEQPRPLQSILGPNEIDVLRAKAQQMRQPLSSEATPSEALILIARFGGHRKSSGSPGWLTITRGIERLQTLAEGWALARSQKM